MNENSNSHRTQIIVAIIGVIGAVGVAFVSNLNTPPTEYFITPDNTNPKDALEGFYVRDGLTNSPVMKITSAGSNEYKFEVFNHPWPWEATVQKNGANLTGYGRFPKSKATMDFKGRVGGDGAIHSEYHFITKGDGTLANGRVDSHIWTLRTN